MPAFQFPPCRISNSDNIRGGNAESPNRDVTKHGAPAGGNAEAQAVMVVDLGTPALIDADGISASQTVTGVGTAFLINGALASAGAVTFDVPRTVDAAWTNAAVITITGTDAYGQAMVEASASGTSHTGKKAFKTVTGITTSATITGATAGSGAKLGLPYRPVIGGFISGILNENTADAGTYTAPERSASTSTSADVRGVYAYAGTADGVNRFKVRYAMQGGPLDSDLYGIAQYAG